MVFSYFKSNDLVNAAARWIPLLQWASWIFAVFILAKLFWLWFLYFSGPVEVKPLSIQPGTIKASTNSVNVSELLKRDLFGSVEKQVSVKTVVDEVAPETSLNLSLKGIYASTDRNKANAIIQASGGKQEVYFIDEKLNVGGQVFLREVYVDRVILETNGRRETLKLEGEDIFKTSPKLAIDKSTDERDEVLDKRSNQRISQKLNQYKEKFLTDPKSVSDIINGRPHFVDGQLMGFSISPGRDKDLFQELGLRQGDLVTSINGIALTNMQDAMSLMEDAQSIEELNVEIERDGESQSLLLNLNDKVGM